MSEMNLAPVCFPPQFPAQGRLPSRVDQVEDNLRIQREPGATHRRALAEIEQRHAELVASGVSLPPAPTPQTDVMDAERLAQAQKEIDVEWQAYYESIGEVNDASA